MSLKMTEKKTRLLCEDDVIKAVDKHTNDDGTLDDDISCILEEIKDYRDKLITNNKGCNVPMQPTVPQMPPIKPIMAIEPETKLSLTCPRVFMFKADLPIEHATKAQEILKKQIEEGCLVIPDCVEFIGIESPIVVFD